MLLLRAAPINTPIDATIITRLKLAARDPMADETKLTASLLTPY